MSDSPLWLGRLGVVDGLPPPRRVPFEAPWTWLATGWRDVWTMPHVSIVYGAFFTLAAALLAIGLWVVGAPSLFLALAGGFLLIGPFVAVGLYEASRRLAAGQVPNLGEVVVAGLGARGELAFFGAVLLFAFFVWLQLAFLLLMLFLGTSEVPRASTFMHTLLFTPQGLGLLVVGSLIGGIIAAMIFAISAVAVPMLLEKKIDAVTAARASVAAAVHNPKPMALWAALIVVIMAAGFATLLVGLAISFPLIGHATWHAYADIYGSRQSP
jgi:uncharacterized membrane protein